MTKDEAMQMSLDALESLQAWPETPENFKRFRAIEALRTALAQPEPEPVAWITVVETKQGPSCQVNWTKMRGISHEPLYTAPLQRKPLRDDQIEDVFFDMSQYAKVDLKAFARAIEAAHGIGEEK